MLIRHVELTNVKSYDDCTVRFTPGVNAVCGKNGSGKSTILEGIGFVLFDYLPYSQAEFIREGEKTATVTVRFLSGRDGREYDVTRRIGKNAAYFVTDPALNIRVAEQKQDVSDWLRDHMGISATAEISDVYQNAIGVPQGLLTAAFLETAARRKGIFDPLLQVDEYEKAWANLRDVERFEKDSINSLDVKLASLTQDSKRAVELQDKVNDLGDVVLSLQISQHHHETDLAAISETVQDLEADKRQHDKLSMEIVGFERDLQSMNTQVARLAQEVERADRARSVIKRTGPGYMSYREAQVLLAPTKETESNKAEIKKLAEALDDTRTVYSNLAAEIKQIEKHLADLKPNGPGVCPLCGQDLESTAELGNRLSLQLVVHRPELERLAREGSGYKTSMENLQEAIDKHFETARNALATHKQDHDRYVHSSELSDRLDDLQDEETDLGVKMIACEKKLELLREDLDTLGFDASAYGQAHDQRREVERNLADVKGRLQVTQSQLDDMIKELDGLVDAQEALESAQEEREGWVLTLGATEKIRSALKEAGPHITKSLVQVISHEADRIFGDIVQDGSMSLRWDASYEITVEHKGSDRKMHQFSGGEQVAAAIAVRLALLKEMSAVDLAFFDEPAANMDTERRELLAEQIMKIQGFGQMLVISHDSTFESSAENTILVEKNNGVSQVQS